MPGRLKTYSDKRDFRRTPEPKGTATRSRSRRPRFVIHQHDASRRHWDFRLESEGVLCSWAVPKGPSTDPRDKRLAVQVEDHPVDYLDFEGVIPEGEYGAGPVIVWDAGTYGNLTRRRGQDGEGEEMPVPEAIEAGHLAVWLEGQKLRGGYVLQRFRGDDQWLLVKMSDEGADARRRPARTERRSVLSGATIEEVGGTGGGAS